MVVAQRCASQARSASGRLMSHVLVDSYEPKDEPPRSRSFELLELPLLLLLLLPLDSLSYAPRDRKQTRHGRGTATREPISKRERAADVARTGGSLPAQARPLQALHVEKTHLHDRKIGTKQVVAASRMWSPRRTSSTSSRHRRSDSRSSDRGCCPRVQSFGAWRRSMGSCSTPGISWILESLARVHHYRTHAGISDGARWCASDRAMRSDRRTHSSRNAGRLVAIHSSPLCRLYLTLPPHR